MLARLIFAAFAFLCAYPAFAATTLLPPGMQCFTDANGAIISGSLNMFYPATTTPKPTWQDSTQTALNTQPIQLDANGCATIYGIGSYRQQLYDGPVVGGSTTGNLIFDKITTDTSAYNAVFWAGLSAGTANVITIVDPGFNGTDGTVINFTAVATNTGSATINPSGFGAISVVKSTTAGPVSLTGGEIIQNNQISVVYSANANTFTILNPPIQSVSGSTSPRCGITGLKIINDPSTPNSILDITATTVVMTSASGISQLRSNINVNINTSTGTVAATPGGMDGEAPGTSAWIYITLIDNGSSTSAVGSLAAGNGFNINFPSGYSYKCYAGAVRVDGSGNLLRTLQYGTHTQYTVTAATNTPNMPIMASGNSGNPSTPTWSAVSVSSFVPPIATEIKLVLFMANSGSLNTSIIAAPNNNYGSFSNTGNPPPLENTSGSGEIIRVNHMGTFILESTNVYYASNAGVGPGLAVMGWTDGSANAN